jgi:hypothetical protein
MFSPLSCSSTREFDHRAAPALIHAAAIFYRVFIAIPAAERQRPVTRRATGSCLNSARLA